MTPFSEFSWDGSPLLSFFKVDEREKSQLTGKKGVKSGNQSGWNFLIA